MRAVVADDLGGVHDEECSNQDSGRLDQDKGDVHACTDSDCSRGVEVGAEGDRGANGRANRSESPLNGDVLAHESDGAQEG